jgi:hypothetical protein
MLQPSLSGVAIERKQRSVRGDWKFRSRSGHKTPRPQATREGNTCCWRHAGSPARLHRCILTAAASRCHSGALLAAVVSVLINADRTVHQSKRLHRTTVRANAVAAVGELGLRVRSAAAQYPRQSYSDYRQFGRGDPLWTTRASKLAVSRLTAAGFSRTIHNPVISSLR